MLMPNDSAATRHQVNQSRADQFATQLATQLATKATDRARSAPRTNPVRQRHGADLLVSLRLDDFLAAVISAGANVMAKMNLAADRFHAQGRFGKKRVRAMHAALGRRLFILLDSHVGLLKGSIGHARTRPLTSRR